MANILNVSQNGNVITERTAKLLLGNVEATIEEHYMNARRNKEGKKASQNDLDHLEIKGAIFPLSDAGVFYEMLWYQFFRKNESLVDEIRKYDDFVDDVDSGENIMNSTARVFRIIKKYGMNGLKSNCKDFAIKVSNIQLPPNDNSFEALDQKIRKLVKKNYGEIPKIKTMDEITDPIMAKLYDVRYDEVDGNCSPSFVEQALRNIRREYERLLSQGEN